MLNYTLVIPVLNKPEFLIKLLHSIDKEEVPERLLIIVNGEESVYQALNICILDITTHWNDWKDVQVHYALPDYNIGVAKSWNHGVKTSTPPWIISNFDILFNKGSIEKMLDGLEDHDIVTLDWGYCLFACRPSLFEKIGYFDENFYPAYWEDTDFDRRVSLSTDVKKLVLDGRQLGLCHGGCSTAKGYENKPLGDFLHVSRAMNEQYYVEKWGGTLGEEKFNSPYGIEAPLSYWVLTQEKLIEKFDLWERLNGR